MNRLLLAVVLVLAACTQQPVTTQPPKLPVATRPAEHSLPGYRLSIAPKSERGFEVPTQFLEGHDAYEGVIPSPAQALEERWVFGALTTICRSAFYAVDVDALHASHVVWRELVATLAGDDRSRESTVMRDGLRFYLRRQRSCIYHECKPPLSPPTVTLDVCEDGLRGDEETIIKALASYIPALDGHPLGAPEAKQSSAIFRRDTLRDEVQITLCADQNAQDALRSQLIKMQLAKDANGWAIDSTDKRRSYIFYPPGVSCVVQITGRK